MAAQQSSQQAVLQQDVDALIAQLRDLGVPYSFPDAANEQHSTKYRLAGHTKGNTKDQRKKMRRQTIKILEHTREHLVATLRAANVPDASSMSADGSGAGHDDDGGQPGGALLTVADVLAQAATPRRPAQDAAGDSGAVSASGPAGDQSSDGASSGDLDSSDTDDWVRAYVPSLGARAHAQDTAPPRAGAGAKKTKKRSKLRRSGGKGF